MQEEWATAFGAAFVLVFSLLLPLFLLQPARGQDRNRNRTLVVLGSGGHTTEMLSMLTSLPKPVAEGSVFVIAGAQMNAVCWIGQTVRSRARSSSPRVADVRMSKRGKLSLLCCPVVPDKQQPMP